MNLERFFHESRRAFIIVPTVGLLSGSESLPLGHKEMLLGLGLNNEKASHIIETCPRGFYLGGVLHFYQGVDFRPLTADNLIVAKRYIPELKRLYEMPENVRIYSGMIVGKLGEHWMPMHLLEW